MGSQDNITVIEDEPYQGLFIGSDRQALGQELVSLSSSEATPQDLATIFRSTREAHGYSLDHMSDLTRVRRSYLEAIEQSAFNLLPSRAFAIGYVKAYAKALGLDDESLADRFKSLMPEPSATGLKAPIGAAIEDLKPQYKLYVGIALSLVAAVVAWNLFQRNPLSNGEVKREDYGIKAEGWTQGVPLIRDGVIYVSQPAPAPKDQDIPVPYYTPGLEEGFRAITAERQATTGQPVIEAVQLRKAFNPRGAVFGATPSESSVTIQAKKSVNLVVRGPDGVYFARQLGTGEAYRLPQVSTSPLTIDVSDPKAFEVYYNGEFAGGIDEMSSSVTRLNAKAMATAKLLDAQGAARQINATAQPRATTPVARPRLETVPSGPIPYMPSQPQPQNQEPEPQATTGG